MGPVVVLGSLPCHSCGVDQPEHAFHPSNGKLFHEHVGPSCVAAFTRLCDELLVRAMHSHDLEVSSDERGAP